MKKILIALTLTLLTNISAFAAPTITYRAGETKVKLAEGFLTALNTLKVTPSTIAPTKINKRAVANFPIPQGSLDLANAKGEIIHTGGLRLFAGNTLVELSQYIIDTTNSAGAVITGVVTVNGNLVGRLKLFNLTLPSITLPLPNARTINIPNVAVKLSSEAATALNSSFGITAFTGGFDIGTASVVLQKKPSTRKLF